MATKNEYTGDGSTTDYSFTFEYLEQSDVKVSLNGVATTDYIFASPTLIRFDTAPANNVAIAIKRETEVNQLKATFFPGSSIRAQDLNNNFQQALFITQETVEEVNNSDAATVTSTANQALSVAQQAQTAAAAAETAAQNAVDTAISSGDNVSELTNDSGYITDAGVTQIVAGTNVTISPTGGTGAVTVNATHPTNPAVAAMSYGEGASVNGATTLNVSYNVSSVTRTNTGRYSVAFTNNLASANYVVVGTADGNGVTNNFFQVQTRTTSGFAFVLLTPSGSTTALVDTAYNFVVYNT